MKKSLKAFMKGIIDYAGLFPPADLSLDAAIQNYAHYRRSSDAWMLARFIIPASKLSELSPYSNSLFSEKDPYEFSVLGNDTDTLADFHSEIEKVTDFCRAFCSEHSGKVITDSLEIKLAKEAALSHDVDLLKQLMDETAEKLSRWPQTPEIIFYETLLEDSWKKDVPAIIEAISRHNQAYYRGRENYRCAAFKLRCGGIEAHHFPSVEQVAYILHNARDYNVPVKGTAGLHHPIRHYAEPVQTKMHGFFNVFGGAMLGYANHLNVEEFEEILREEDPEQFTFTDEALSWKQYAVRTQEIKKLRDVALLSYGSCSFDEPREDLQKLKLL